MEGSCRDVIPHHFAYRDWQICGNQRQYSLCVGQEMNSVDPNMKQIATHLTATLAVVCVCMCPWPCTHTTSKKGMLSFTVDYFWLPYNPARVPRQWHFKTMFAVYKKLKDKVVAVYTMKAYRSRAIAPLICNLHNQVELSHQLHTPTT